VFVVPPELHDPPDPGLWNQRCQACHATESRPRLDGEHPDTLVGEFGIACEACHGPGGAHVAQNQNPLRRYQHHASGADDTIVQPRKLPAARSAQVCGQCHSVSVLRHEQVDRWSREGMPYRPGQDLDATVRVIGREDRGVPEVRAQLRRDPGLLDNSFWPDGQVRVSGREYNGLLLSPCYRRGTGDRQLDCSSCHQLHRPPGVDAEAWRDGQLRAGMRGNAACTSCHPALREPAALAAHTHHRPESSGSNCYNCHMSYTTFGLMKAMRSHTITSPSVQTELATGRPNACNQCHLDRTLQWADENLHAFYGMPSAALDDEQREVAASVRWLLAGDAGQRALAAWSFGWDEAQAAAGTDWMAPYLARLLDDPYYVVRFTAARALRSLPGAPFASPLREYEVLADRAVAGRAGEAVTAQWRAGYRGPLRPALLIEQRGLDQARFGRLYARRDDRPVYLAE
jgi:hypothetical protein